MSWLQGVACGGIAALAMVGSVLVLWATSSDERAGKVERWIRRWKERNR